MNVTFHRPIAFHMPAENFRSGGQYFDSIHIMHIISRVSMDGQVYISKFMQHYITAVGANVAYIYYM